jgi:hypothetical protein
MQKNTVVRFKINAGLWRAFKAGCMIRDQNPFDEIRKFIKREMPKKLRGVKVKRSQLG